MPIVDFHMPEMNGFELHQHIVSNGLQIPTILITADDDAALQGFSESDLVASLRKPVQEEPLFRHRQSGRGGSRQDAL